MGNCCSCCRKLEKKYQDNQVQPSPLSILIVGLDGAGKSEIGHTLATNGNNAKKRTDYSSTNGCHIFKTKINGCLIRFTEVGGSEGIRKIWPYYYQEAEGVIFVVDSTDYARLEETHKLFAQFIRNIHISGKPVLVLANKQDSSRSIDTTAVCYYMDIERLANETCTPCYMESSGIGDGEINNGLFVGIRWLTKTICDNLPTIRNRIEFDRSYTPSNSSSEYSSERSERRPLTARRIRRPSSAKVMPRPQSAPPKIVIPAFNYFVSEASSPICRAVASVSPPNSSDKYRTERLHSILSSVAEIKPITNNYDEIEPAPLNIDGAEVLIVTDLHNEVDE